MFTVNVIDEISETFSDNKFCWPLKISGMMSRCLPLASYSY